MTKEMTSFVLRFVREVSEEQGGRWRDLVQHVQSGVERNFATFADAVQFMQERVVENTAEALEGKQVTDKGLFTDMASEMSKMWGELGPHMAEMWKQTAGHILGQSAAFRSQIDQSVATALKTWGLPAGVEQEAIVSRLARLGEKIDQLATRIEAFENELASQQRRSSGEHTSEETE